MDQINNQTNAFGQADPNISTPKYIYQEPIPNSTAVLVLGIISIATCWCYGVIGLILSIIALVLSGNAKRTYMLSPEKYTPGSFSNLKAGKVCAIIGLSVSALYILFFIFYILAIFSFVGSDFLDAFDGFNSFNY